MSLLSKIFFLGGTLLALYSPLIGQTELGPIKVTTVDTQGYNQPPSSPQAGYCRQYYNNTTGQLTYINSAGNSCTPLPTSGSLTDAMNAASVKPSVAVVENVAITFPASGCASQSTIDGVACSNGRLCPPGFNCTITNPTNNIVLLVNQASASQNGPWVMSASNWARPTWWASGSTTQPIQFSPVFVLYGTFFGNSTWVMTSSGVKVDDSNTGNETWIQTPFPIGSSSTQYALAVYPNTGLAVAPAAGITTDSTNNNLNVAGTLTAGGTSNSISISGNSPQISVAGTNTSINLLLAPKAGAVQSTGPIQAAINCTSMSNTGCSNTLDFLINQQAFALLAAGHSGLEAEPTASGGGLHYIKLAVDEGELAALGSSATNTFLGAITANGITDSSNSGHSGLCVQYGANGLLTAASAACGTGGGGGGNVENGASAGNCSSYPYQACTPMTVCNENGGCVYPGQTLVWNDAASPVQWQPSYNLQLGNNISTSPGYQQGSFNLYTEGTGGASYLTSITSTFGGFSIIDNSPVGGGTAQYWGGQTQTPELLTPEITLETSFSGVGANLLLETAINSGHCSVGGAPCKTTGDCTGGNGNICNPDTDTLSINGTPQSGNNLLNASSLSGSQNTWSSNITFGQGATPDSAVAASGPIPQLIRIETPAGTCLGGQYQVGTSVTAYQLVSQGQSSGNPTVAPSGTTGSPILGVAQSTVAAGSSKYVDVCLIGPTPVLFDANAATAGHIATPSTVTGGDATDQLLYTSSNNIPINVGNLGLILIGCSGSCQGAVSLKYPDATGRFVNPANGGTGVANTATTTLGTSSINWGTLGTGLVKNTIATGAKTIATYSDIVGLFSSCSGSQYLGYDGNCHIAAGSGTVTSVTFTGDGIIDNSTPSTAVTTSGSVIATPLTQSANTVLAGPTTGSSANPTFRSLVSADFPSSPAFLGTVTVPAGTTTLPSIQALGSNSDTGAYWPGSAGNIFALVSGGGSGPGTEYVRMVGNNSGGGLKMGTGGSLQWSSTTSSTASLDTSITRAAAGKVEICSGSTCASDGTLLAAAYTTSGKCNANGSAANPSVVTCVPASASSGAFSCAQNASGGTCTINTSAVTASSVINVWEVADEGGVLSVTCSTTPTLIPAILVATKTGGTGFTINMPTLSSTPPNPACFDFTIN